MRINSESFFYSAFALALSNIVLQILSFIYRILLSRFVGAQGMGIFQLSLPFYTVIHGFCLSGITMSVNQLSAKALAKKDFVSLKLYVRVGFFIFLLLFIVITAFTLSFSDKISLFLSDSRSRLLIILFLPCLLFTGVENVIKNYFLGTNNIKPPIISEISEQSSRIIFVISLLLLLRPTRPESSAGLIVVGMALSEIISATCLFLMYRRFRVKVTTKRNLPLKSILSNIARIAFPVTLSTLISTSLSSLNSVLIPRRLVCFGMAQESALSLFGVIFGMTIPLLSFPLAFLTPITTIIIPRLSENIATENISNARRKAGKAIHCTSLISAPAFSLLIPLGVPLCRILYTDSRAGLYIFPLCIGILFLYYQISTTSILNGIGMQKYTAAVNLICGSIELLFIWGIGKAGIKSFLAGNIFCSAFAVVANLVMIRRKLGLKIQWHNWFFIPFMSAIPAGLMSKWTLSMLLHEAIPSFPAICLSSACGLIVYALMLLMQGTQPFKYLSNVIKQS